MFTDRFTRGQQVLAILNQQTIGRRNEMCKEREWSSEPSLQLIRLRSMWMPTFSLNTNALVWVLSQEIQALQLTKPGALSAEMVEVMEEKEALSWIKCKDWTAVEVESDC